MCTGAKVPQERKLNGTKVVCGAKVPWVRKFHGTKVLGTFAAEERKFHRSESSMERKFSQSLYDLFAPGNESAEEQKGQLPSRFGGRVRKKYFFYFLSQINVYDNIVI